MFNLILVNLSFVGNVFGGKDPFSGLGIFFDTYSNYNDEHSVSKSLYRLVFTCAS